MPKVLDECVSSLMRQGKSKSEAFQICSKSTGYVRGKGGTWIKRRKKRKGKR